MMKNLTYVITLLLFVGCRQEFVLEEFTTARYQNLDLGDDKLTCVDTYPLNNEVLIGTETGNIYYSPNNGITWSKTKISNFPVFQVKIKGPNDMYLINGKSGVNDIFVSTPNSLNWKKTWENLNSVNFINDSIGYGIGKNYRTLLKTVNKGKTWEHVKLFNTFDRYYHCIFSNENDGYIFRNYNSSNDVAYTSDGGKTLDYSTLEDILSLERTDKSEFLRLGEKGKLYSNTEIQSSINSIHTIGNSKWGLYAADFQLGQALIVGENSIYKRNDEGTWDFILTSKGASFEEVFTDVSFINSTSALLITEEGKLIKILF